MANPKHALTEVVKDVLADNWAWGPDRVREYLEADVMKWAPLLLDKEEDRVTEVEREALLKLLPARPTIGRIKAGMPEEERRRRESVRWPESFEAGLLPWEAGDAALRLLRVFQDARRTGHVFAHPMLGPRVKHVRWWWRLSQAAPNMPLLERWIATVQLSHADQQPAPARDLELYLAYRGWSHDGDYDEALKAADGVGRWVGLELLGPLESGDMTLGSLELAAAFGLLGRRVTADMHDLEKGNDDERTTG